MRLLTFVRFIRMITKDGPADLDKIQDMGLLAVKLTQIFALRPDLLSEEKCRQLQSLYQRANSIPKEDSMKLIEDRAPSGSSMPLSRLKRNHLQQRALAKCIVVC